MSDRERWLAERLNGIGASEAAAVLGMSPYMTNEQLWEIKTRRKPAQEISNNPFVKYGQAAEEHLRELFALDFPQYMVFYNQYEIVRNPKYPFIFATLDGELSEMENSAPPRKILRTGILEIKTTEIMQPGQWEQWKNKIPQQYYIQCLHQLLATGYSFVILKAQIKYHKDGELNVTSRHYTIEREDVAVDLEMLLKEEVAFWECVKQDKRPNTKLPNI